MSPCRQRMLKLRRHPVCTVFNSIWNRRCRFINKQRIHIVLVFGPPFDVFGNSSIESAELDRSGNLSGMRAWEHERSAIVGNRCHCAGVMAQVNTPAFHQVQSGPWRITVLSSIPGNVGLA